MKLLIALTSLLLIGCVTPAPMVKTEVITMEVPVAVPCKIRPVERPTMPLDNIFDEADIFDIMKSILAEIERREGYEKELEAAIKECQ